MWGGGGKHADERGVDERLERRRGIESVEPQLGRRRVDQLLLHRLLPAVQEGSGSLKRQRKRQKCGKTEIAFWN